jgi:hypothetical protein
MYPPNTNQSAEATACHLRLGVCLEGNANHNFKNLNFILFKIIFFMILDCFDVLMLKIIFKK